MRRVAWFSSGAAMQGILSGEAAYQTFDALAGVCYAIADTMLKEREK